MNCSACGAQLPNQATHCPRCGAATSSYYTTSPGAPDDPTVASSPEILPPPPPGSHPNPYQPYLTPEPPSSSGRRGMRVGIIIGVVLLIVLLGAGGAFAFFASSSANNAAAAASATATAQAYASATAAAQHLMAKGTLALLNTTTTNTQQDGDNQISSLVVHGAISGDISGSFTAEETVVQHPDKTSTFSGTSVCTCTVAGKAGTLIWSLTGTQTADGNFQGQSFDLHGTGGLAGIQGQGTFQGKGSHANYSTDLSFHA